jgi:DNA-binding response OmpR family regulator
MIGIIIVTAADTTSDTHRVQALRAVVLRKPFLLGEFRAALAEAVALPTAAPA